MFTRKKATSRSRIKTPAQYDKKSLRTIAYNAAVDAGVNPDAFIRLVTQESQWNPRAKSNKGAMGLTQLMPATAKAYGVSNPFDPAQNLKAGAKYFAFLWREYGGCNGGSASFNGGPESVDYFNRTGWHHDPTVPRHLWRNETAEYVQIVCKGI